MACDRGGLLDPGRPGPLSLPASPEGPLSFQSVVWLSGLYIPILEEKWWKTTVRSRASCNGGRRGGTKTIHSFARFLPFFVASLSPCQLMPNMAASLCGVEKVAGSYSPMGRVLSSGQTFYGCWRGEEAEADIGTKVSMMQSGARPEPSSVTDKPYDPGRVTRPLRTSVSSL